MTQVRLSPVAVLQLKEVMNAECRKDVRGFEKGDTYDLRITTYDDCIDFLTKMYHKHEKTQERL